MAQRKILQAVGLTALCEHIKDIRQTTDATSTAAVQIATALESLSSEVEELINDVDAEVDDLEAAVIAGEVAAPLATQGKDSIGTQSGVEIYAYRIL
ncbi:MAG: hypothetical protein J6N51_10780 [Selenomonas sp.]|nr:hypothetical protein [Selenomonas sp.]MBP3731002.1 hypothetical protein [Mailhella sp.]